MTTTCLLLLSAVFAFPAHAVEASPRTEMPKAKLQPFLQAYCVRCHGADEPNGQMRLDNVSWTISTNDEAQRWQDVLDILNGGDMPPEDEKQPTTDEMSATLDVMTGALLQARKRLTDHGGEILMRRLNRREYAGTIRELFGFDIPADMIPEDGEAATFDTVGAEQLFTSNHFEKYLALGREIAATGFNWAGKPRTSETAVRRQPEERVTHRLRASLADLDNKMRMKNEGKTWKEMGFKDEGEMKIIFSQFKSRAGKPRRYLQYPLVDSGIYLTDANNETKRFGVNRGGADPRASYRFRVRAGIVGSPPSIRTFFRVTDQVGTTGVLKVRGNDQSSQIVEMTYRPKMGQRNVTLHVEENRADIRVLDAYLRRVDPDGDPAAIWVDWLEIEGPFYSEDRAFFEKLLHPESPARGKQTMAWRDSNARELIERFAYEAFRHKSPQTEYVNRLLAIFQSNRDSGQTFDQAMSDVMGVILASPQFLFIQEAAESVARVGEDLEGIPAAPERRVKRQLGDRELAIRLSYFLWSSPPDAELYRCAEDNTLSQPSVLHAQVERMLNDRRSAAFMEGFTSQWADLQRFDAITVDEQANYYFNKGVRYSATREVLEFFRTLVAENLPAANLISSDFVVVNALLGQHYGLANVESDEFQKVMLPSDSPRGGMLGQTAILTLGSNGERSSPVIRGAYVMEKLLHDKPAPPPPNVPELGAATNKPATNREMVLLHQKQAVCASCHKKMDVIGFGLENFDTIGKWRDSEQVGRKQVPIEPGGRLPGGGTFTDIQGLESELLKEESQLAEELVESLLAYALGRTVEFSDTDDVDAILQNLSNDHYRVRSMVHAVAGSQLFRSK